MSFISRAIVIEFSVNCGQVLSTLQVIIFSSFIDLIRDETDTLALVVAILLYTSDPSCWHMSVGGILNEQ